MIEGIALKGLNHLLGQAAWARQRLSGFAGRRALFEMPPWRLALAVTADGRFESAGNDSVDVTVTLPADAPLLAIQGTDRVMAAAHVTGNAEFATELSFVLKNLRWDAEEDLSQFVGDIAAHRIVGGVSALASWQKQAARNLGENLAEYLREESALVLPRRDLTAFKAELEQLTSRLEKLETRVRELR